MAKAISQNRTGVKENAPRITTITVPKDKIREMIGSGGKVIREIVEKTGTKIDIEDDGTIKIASSDPAAADAAIQRSEERRVGKECVSTCRYRWSTDHKKKKKKV